MFDVQWDGNKGVRLGRKAEMLSCFFLLYYFMKTLIYSLLALLLISPNLSAEVQETGLSFDHNEVNLAGLFTMTNENGRLRNLELMDGVFSDGKLGFKAEKYHNVGSAEIYKRISELTGKLSENGTLLLYLNSHGGGSNQNFAMTAAGGSFKFSKALKAIASVKKVKRLIVLIDTCHAAGGIQEGFDVNGELLRNLQNAKPTAFLPELPNQYKSNTRPFIGIFDILRNNNVDYGEDSGAYEEALIISSSSVEDLSTRGVFASRLKTTFDKVKNNRDVTVAQFLKMFADSHSQSGQQPYYKVVPDKNMLNEFLFRNYPAEDIQIYDYRTREKIPGKGNVLVPSQE